METTLMTFLLVQTENMLSIEQTTKSQDIEITIIKKMISSADKKSQNRTTNGRIINIASKGWKP